MARSIDTNIKHLAETLKRAGEHKGVAFVEIYQNCNVFNDHAWDWATDKETEDRHADRAAARQAARVRQEQAKRAFASTWAP